MQDGVCENFTAAMLAPYLDGHGHATGNAGHSFVDAEELKEAVVAAWRPRASRCTCTRSATGASARRSTRSQRPGPRATSRPAAPHRPPPGGPPRRRAALRRAGRRRQRPGAVGVTHEPQMDDLTVPFLGEERSRWQYPFGDLHRLRRPAGHGQRLAGHLARPAGRHPHRGHPHRVRRAGRPASRSCPEQALDLTTAFAAYTSGSAWVNGRDRLDGAGVLAPGHAADLVVLDRDPFAGPVERDRRDPGGVDLGRGLAGLRWLSASERATTRTAAGCPKCRDPVTKSVENGWVALSNPQHRSGSAAPMADQTFQNVINGELVDSLSRRDLRRHRPDHRRGLRPGADVRGGGRRPGLRRRRRSLRGLGRRHPAGPRQRAAQDRRRDRGARSRRSTPSSARTPASRSG